MVAACPEWAIFSVSKLSRSTRKRLILLTVLLIIFGLIAHRFEPRAVRWARRAADNLLVPPPTFVDWRAAAENLSARRRFHRCCVVILLQFWMTKKVMRKFWDRTNFFYFEVRTKFFSGILEKISLGRQRLAAAEFLGPAVCSRRSKLTTQ